MRRIRKVTEIRIYLAVIVIYTVMLVIIFA